MSDFIINTLTKETLRIKKFLGKGAYGVCLEVINSKNINLACKTIDKLHAKKSVSKKTLQQEIVIHRQLKHMHIVSFLSCFEDKDFLYIVMELCTNKSLEELHRRRILLTEMETRYYSRQITKGIKYMHDRNVIHRDLKLQNVFLDKNMVVKIGDFGFALKLENDEERRKTRCGTPLYQAPELLRNIGYSKEVDIWAIGCMIYTLVAGHLPFDGKNLPELQSCIKKTKYTIPLGMSILCQDVVYSILTSDPLDRPSPKELLEMAWYEEYIPQCMPTSTLTTAPRQVNNEIYNLGLPIDLNGSCRKIDVVDHMTKLNNLVQSVLKVKPLSENESMRLRICEKPKHSPVVWVTRWVDYSNLCGVAYQLSDQSTGLVFRDGSRMIATTGDKDTAQVQYSEPNTPGEERTFLHSNPPKDLAVKATYLGYCYQYMDEKLLPAGSKKQDSEMQALTRLAYVMTWIQKEDAIAFLLSNGTVQVNMKDHIKLVLCPLMGAVTKLDEKGQQRTFSLTLLAKQHPSQDLLERLTFAQTMINSLHKSINDKKLKPST